MDKVDFKKMLKHLYQPPANEFVVVDVPEMQYLKIDGMGDPATSEAYTDALGWLYPVAYKAKFFSKTELGRDYVVMPLEGLWWADDLSAFAKGDRDAWKWTMMIMQPDWISKDMINEAVTSAAEKLDRPTPATLRLEPLDEGTCVQILHIGPYADEAPTLARLHDEFLPEHGLIETGHHHEIYLSDVRRTDPEKLKTVLRQPVRAT